MTNNKEDWEVDKYFDESEPEEHWELRRRFLIKNKNKYTEDYVVALSRVFTNVEFMGCSYNKDVMARVASMSEGIVEEYRQRKKQKLQRTFVKASDAAESRFTGNRQPHSTTIGSKEYSSANTNDKSYSSATTTGQPNYDSILEKVRSQPGFRGKVILIKNVVENHPFSVIHRSITSQTPSLKPWIERKEERNKEGQSVFNFVIGEEIICSGHADNEKDAKMKLGQIALENLQATCFTLETKSPVSSGENIEKNDPSPSVENESLLKSDNVGLKLMKMMGWSGKGLGKNEHGREDNIQISDQVSRSGLGFGSNSQDVKKVRSKLEKIIKDYAASNNSKHLVFSSDFTAEERKFIHTIARFYNLKTRSYGNTDTNRRLVLSRNYTNWERVELLLKCGLSDELYELKLPTNFM